MDANQELIPEDLTPKRNMRKIPLNPSWEYHKEKKRLSPPEIQKNIWVEKDRRGNILRIYEGLFGFHSIHGWRIR